MVDSSAVKSRATRRRDRTQNTFSFISLPTGHNQPCFTVMPTIAGSENDEWFGHFLESQQEKQRNRGNQESRQIHYRSFAQNDCRTGNSRPRPASARNPSTPVFGSLTYLQPIASAVSPPRRFRADRLDILATPVLCSNRCRSSLLSVTRAP